MTSSKGCQRRNFSSEFFLYFGSYFAAQLIDMTEKTEHSTTSEFSSEFEPETRNNFDTSIARLLEAIGASDIGDLAASLGISRQAINKARSVNKIPPAWFIHIGRIAKVSIDWLVTGEGPMRRGENATATAQPQPPPAPPPPDADFKISDMLTRAAEILESNTIHRTSLASVISSLHQAVRSEQLLARIDDRMTLLEQGMEELRRENQELKQHKSEQLSQFKAVGA